MPDAVILAPQWIAPVAPDPRVLTGHAVLVEDGRIAALAPLDELRNSRPETPVQQLPGQLLTPGFVNLHSHAAMALLRGAADDMSLHDWLRQRIWPAESKLVGPEFVRDGALLAAAEMLLGGITCFNDMYFFPEAAIEAAQLLEMRSVHGIVVIDFASAYAAAPADYLRKGLELRDRFRHDPLIGFCLAPHAPYTVSDESLQRVATLSRELGLPVHIHVHETSAEIDESMAIHGKRPLERLEALGLVGPELIAVHAVHLNEAELQLLATRGASVAHCPHSNLKLASGIASTARMLELGIRIGIGTDGSASNNRLDLLQEARCAALLAKGSSGRAETWPAAKVLQSMTLDAATALGLENRIGSIEPGKRADLVAIDLSAPELQPVFEPLAQLIYAAGREHVQHVWVDGKPVVQKRQLVAEGARQGLSEVVGRTSVWHNRLGEILSG
ncbi:MAG TPA: TRZ/ATZ family hydrolase [Burkholderiaceae bacterium]|nr:TRZ/ATZ family hydrolase [Burkholderiaceae bacterium]